MADPQVFTLPPGADFPAHLVAGLLERMADQPPEAMASIQLFVNTARMRRRIEALFQARGAMILPRLHLLTDLASDPTLGLPPPIPPLRRRLELAQLVAGLLKVQPDLAPRAALYDLADSLARLMDEMQGEGVSPADLARLDVSGHSEHWARTQAFLGILAPQLGDTTAPDAEARQSLAVDRMIARWETNPPQHPVIVAGSTGSRGTTARFMQAVAHLPKGAVVLPGFDTDTPTEVWEAMSEALTAEDHHNTASAIWPICWEQHPPHFGPGARFPPPTPSAIG